VEKNKNNPLIHEKEIEGINRLIKYTRVVKTGHAYTSREISRHRDFKTFYSQYDQRRNKNFLETFKHTELQKWFVSIPDTQIEAVGLYDGDATKGSLHKQELEQRAKKEGWVLKPQGANPGSNEYKEND